MGKPDIPEIPQPFQVVTSVSGYLDMDLDEIRIKELPEIRSNSKVDLGLDKIRIKELPTIHLEMAMKPTRIHFPVNIRFGLNSLGMELLALNVCGESMVVIEDYVPHRTEICR